AYRSGYCATAHEAEEAARAVAAVNDGLIPAWRGQEVHRYIVRRSKPPAIGDGTDFGWNYAGGRESGGKRTARQVVVEAREYHASNRPDPCSLQTRILDRHELDVQGWTRGHGGVPGPMLSDELHRLRFPNRLESYDAELAPYPFDIPSGH